MTCFSADTEFPRKLVEAGGAQASSLVTFAVGKLVLWTTKPGLDLASIDTVVRDNSVHRLAIANPDTAPYGRAALEVLSRLGLSEVAKAKLVYGDNIAQTAQFVSTGNADAGFVAFSLVLSPKLPNKGHWMEVPSSLYTPIAQAGVLTKRGATNDAARQYLEFLTSPAARKILTQFGYGLP